MGNRRKFTVNVSRTRDWLSYVNKLDSAYQPERPPGLANDSVALQFYRYVIAAMHYWMCENSTSDNETGWEIPARDFIHP